MMSICIIFLLLGEITLVPAVTQPSNIYQDSGIITANVGDTVTLRCFYQDDASVLLSWYQQTLGDKPQLVSTIMKYYDEATFYHEFKDNPRFSMQSGEGIHHLIIEDLRLSDSATYYCGSSDVSIIQFSEGVVLNVKSSEFKIQIIIQQPVSESVLPGDSVTLNCTVHTETCDGEHSVYWFRHGGSQPGMIYSHVGGCKEHFGAGSPMQSCVHHLPKQKLSLSDAGTYYCAVALCGEMLFGNGTQLTIKDPTTVSLIWVYSLGGALVVSFILIFVLVYNMYKLTKKECPGCRGDRSNARGSVATDAVGQDEDNLHYAALRLNKRDRSRRQRDNVETVCVHSGIRE